MIKVYADLVELGYRVLEPTEGKIQVPTTWRDGVRQELINRGFITT